MGEEGAGGAIGMVTRHTRLPFLAMIVQTRLSGFLAACNHAERGRRDESATVAFHHHEMSSLECKAVAPNPFVGSHSDGVSPRNVWALSVYQQ